ncbi:MAG TPA: hypothetical protein VGT99_06855 [Gammaproteobacteria bacterium]|nr:hypothetical protein [Gammaproteobacteria bacterium]
MDDAEIERKRIQNLARVIARALEACTRADKAGDLELEMLLTGPHAKAVTLGILEFAAQTSQAVSRGARLWQAFGGKENLLYDLVADRSRLGIHRVKNLLDAGWDPNLAQPGTGRTALMQVVNNWTPENRTLVSMLIAAGADPKLASASGQTVLESAPLTMRNFIQALVMDVKQDTTNRSRRKQGRVLH